MKTTTIIITLLIISGILTILAGVYPNQAEKIINYFSKEEIKLAKEFPEDNYNSQTPNSPTNPVSDSTQSSTTQTTAPPGCTLSQISYGIKNLIKNSNCIEYQGEICTSKDIKCSVETYNYDDETSGDFELEFRLTDELNNIIQILYKTEFIQSQGNKTHEVIFKLENENAEKSLTCNYQTINIPKKTIC